MYKRQIYQIAESNRIEKNRFGSENRIESKLFCPNWNALLTVRVDAVRAAFLGVAEVGTQRLLLVGSVDPLRRRLATVDAATARREELERRPRPAVVGALVQPDRVVRPAASAQLQTDVGHLQHLPSDDRNVSINQSIIYL